MTGYTRQSTFIPGDVIKAEHGNNEFNQIVSFASQTGGHKHDGTVAEGAYIPVISDVTNTDKVEIVAGGAKTTGTHQVTGLLVADAGVTLTTGNVILSGASATVDGRDVSVDGTKLDGIESNAKDDQTAAEILTAIKTVDGTGSGLDADILDGLEGAAYQLVLTGQTSIELGSSSVIDIEGTLDFHTSNASGSKDFDGRVLRNSGVNGVFALVQSGTGDVEIAGGTNFTRDGNTVWHSGNDGSGSGLDADTVDGLHSVSFLRSDSVDTKTSGALVFSDNVDLQIGSGADMRIRHDGTANRIDLHVGDLDVRQNGVTSRFTIDRETGNVALTGTVDGRDVAVDGAKLDGIEAGATAGSLVNVQTLTATGTFTPTAGATRFLVYCTGGGAGGGSAKGTVGIATGGGGGGGGTIQAFFNATEMGATAAVTIGAGSAGSSTVDITAGTAGTTTFNPVGTGGTLTAVGGTGGQSAEASSVTETAPGGSGGSLSTGGFLHGVGHSGSSGENVGKASGGGGGGSWWGGGGAPTKLTTNGINAITRGSGGSGAFSATSTLRNGGAGMAGVIIVHEYS